MTTERKEATSKMVMWVMATLVGIIFTLIGYTTNQTLKSIDENIINVNKTVEELKQTVNVSIKIQNGHETQIRILEREIMRLEEQIKSGH